MQIYAKSNPIFKMIFGDPKNKTDLIKKIMFTTL